MAVEVGKTGHQRKKEDWLREDEKTLKPNEQIIAPNPAVDAACRALKHYAENLNQSPALMVKDGGIYQPRDYTAVYTTSVGPWEIGYRIREVPFSATDMVRDIFVMLRDKSPLMAVPEKERSEDRVTTT